jgi:tRNA A-37 threonylcarbamoyl transferase component Bud32
MPVLTPGDEFAGYVVERVLATGGMGEVYLARHTHLGRLDALKVMRSLSADDAPMRARFLREGQLAASLRHRNIVTIYTAGDADGRLFLTMEYIEGNDLRDEIDRYDHLAPSRAVWIVQEAAAALDAAHAHGLVHRDVKPANILLSKPERQGGPERVLLTDFGITRSTTSETGLTGMGELLGTLDYIAPEQIEGGSLDGRVDVYALGCVLYECLVGRPPFPGDTTVAILHAHLSNPVPRPSTEAPGVPPAFDAVVAKAMAKDREDRYATCGELAAAAAAAMPRSAKTVAGAGPPPLPLPSPVAPSASASGRRPLVPVAAGLALVAVVVGAALLLTRGGDDKRAGTRPTASATPTGAAVASGWAELGLGGIAAAWPTIVTGAPAATVGSGPTCRPRAAKSDTHAAGIIACQFANGVDLELLHYATAQDRIARQAEIAGLAKTEVRERWEGGTAYRRDTSDQNGEGPYRWWSFDAAPTEAMFATWPGHTGQDLSGWWRELPRAPL